jgi:hypothetical protein
VHDAQHGRDHARCEEEALAVDEDEAEGRQPEAKLVEELRRRAQSMGR